MSRAILKENRIWLIVDQKDLQTTKNICSITGCKYHLYTKDYDIPLSYKNVKLLIEWNFMFGKTLREWETLTRQESEIANIKLKSIDGFNGTLYPFQSRGVEFIDECAGRALIADEMGLGKTVQALAWCKLHNEESPVLIICPSSVKINWTREVSKWLNEDDFQILDGRTPYEITGKFVVINYDILDSWVPALREYEFRVLIVDEAHYLKNSSAKRTKSFKRLAKSFEKIIALTGTPIENAPIELWNIVSVLNPRIFPNYYAFTQRYCDAKNDGFGRNVKGVSNMEELHRILTSTIMIRRKKLDVLTELPAKIISVIPLTIDNRREYQAAEKQFIEFLKAKFHSDLNKDGIERELKAYARKHEMQVGDVLDSDDLTNIKDLKIEKAKAAPVLVQMGILKQLACKGKMKAVTEWIKDFLESGEKLVVFAINKDVITELMKQFPNAARLDGSTSQVNRQTAIDSFQKDEKCRLFIANMKAGGIGITLTAASNVAMIQFPWTPSELSQAADRVHRISQTKQVTVWNIVAANTIEEKIIKALSIKEKIINDVLDGGVYDAGAIASEVIKLYKIN